MKLIIFDFDLTMTRLHTTNYITKMRRMYSNQIPELVDEMLECIGKNEIICDMFMNPNAIKELRELRKNGVKVAIASYGYKTMIERILFRYGLDDIVDVVMTPIDFGLTEGADHAQSLEGKNIMIDALEKMFKANKEDVLFFDDSYVNINFATKKMYQTCLVSFGSMSLTDFKRIKEFCKN